MQNGSNRVGGDDNDDEEDGHDHNNDENDNDDGTLTGTREEQLGALEEMQEESAARFGQFCEVLESVTHWLESADVEEAIDDERAGSFGLVAQQVLFCTDS